MRYPCLVPKRLCRTKIRVWLEYEGLNRFGEPYPAIEKELECNYQDRAKTVMNAEKKLVHVTGTAMFPGDIAPELPVISGGFVEVFGVRRRIEQGMKARNPDGTVNFCQLEVV